MTSEQIEQESRAFEAAFSSLPDVEMPLSWPVMKVHAFQGWLARAAMPDPQLAEAKRHVHELVGLEIDSIERDIWKCLACEAETGTRFITHKPNCRVGAAEAWLDGMEG